MNPKETQKHASSACSGCGGSGCDDCNWEGTNEAKQRLRAIRERDAYFSEAARTKQTLAQIIPALEVASRGNADALRATCPKGDLTPDEWAALWMARSILERAS